MEEIHYRFTENTYFTVKMDEKITTRIMYRGIPYDYSGPGGVQKALQLCYQIQHVTT